MTVLDAIEARAAAAARIDRYALPREVLAMLDDVPTLLAALRTERAHHAAAVAAAVRAESYAVADLAALRAQVDALRSARADAMVATARYNAAWDKVGAAPPTPAQMEEIASALTATYEAGDALTAAVDALTAPAATTGGA